MNDIARLLAAPPQSASPFPPDSRYHGVPLRTARLPDGREVACLGRRFVPPREAVTVTAMHIVQDRDRLDLLAAQYFGNPTQGWKIVEANGIRDPRTALDATGSRLSIAAATAILGQNLV